MTLYGGPRAWLEQFPLGETVAFSYVHSGLLYPGEVIRAESWLPQWGKRLEGDAYYRIVQASDLSALSNTLTPELVTFIRRMLV